MIFYLHFICISVRVYYLLPFLENCSERRFFVHTLSVKSFLVLMRKNEKNTGEKYSQRKFGGYEDFKKLPCTLSDITCKLTYQRWVSVNRFPLGHCILCPLTPRGPHEFSIWFTYFVTLGFPLDVCYFLLFSLGFWY